MDDLWNPAKFAETGNLPAVAGVIKDRAQFSVPGGIRVLDLCLRTPEQNWQIPHELFQFREAIAIASRYEQKVAPLEYVYITADQKPVPVGGTQRREGWHSDAFIVDDSGRQLDVLAQTAQNVPSEQRIERTYVAYDTLPTLFADGPWEIGDPSDCDGVLRSFDEQAQHKEVVTYPEYTVLCLTPYCVHSVAVHQGTLPLARTFVKIQFSSHRYNRAENTRNPAIDYSGWTWVEREPDKREHRYVKS